MRALKQTQANMSFCRSAVRACVRGTKAQSSAPPSRSLWRSGAAACAAPCALRWPATCTPTAGSARGRRWTGPRRPPRTCCSWRATCTTCSTAPPRSCARRRRCGCGGVTQAERAFDKGPSVLTRAVRSAIRWCCGWTATTRRTTTALRSPTAPRARQVLIPGVASGAHPRRTLLRRASRLAPCAVARRARGRCAAAARDPRLASAL